MADQFTLLRTGFPPDIEEKAGKKFVPGSLQQVMITSCNKYQRSLYSSYLWTTGTEVLFLKQQQQQQQPVL